MLAQKTGFLSTGNVIFSSDVRPFEHVMTLAYTHAIKRDDAVDALSYENFINGLVASGNEDFKLVF